MNGLPSPDKIKRLPLWAQKHIESLENAAAVRKRALLDLQDNTTPTRAWVTDNTLKLGDRYYLPSDRIHFYLGEDTEVMVHVEDGRLTISGIGTNCFLDIQPKVSNVISVGSIKR